jgi:hypothetical protein
LLAIFEDVAAPSIERLTDRTKACRAIAQGQETKVETLFSIIDFGFHKRDMRFDVDLVLFSLRKIVV